MDHRSELSRSQLRFHLALIVLVMLLAMVLVLGIRQFLLYRHCEETTRQTHRLAYRCTALRENALDALLAGHVPDHLHLSRDLEEIEQIIAGVRTDPILPETVRTELVSGQDLIEIDLMLRRKQGPEDPETTEAVHRSLRSLQARAAATHQHLLEHTALLRFHLHRVVVGALAMSLVLSACLFLVAHRSINRLIRSPTLSLVDPQTLQLAIIGSLVAEIGLEVTDRTNSMLNCAQLLLDEPNANNEQQTQLLARMAVDGQKASVLAGGIADIAVMSAEQAPRLGAMLDRIHHLFQPLLRQNGILLHINRHGDTALPEDNTLLQALLLSLLDHSRRFLRESGSQDSINRRIDLAVTVHDHQLQLSLTPCPEPSSCVPGKGEYGGGSPWHHHLPSDWQLRFTRQTDQQWQALLLCPAPGTIAPSMPSPQDPATDSAGS